MNDYDDLRTYNHNTECDIWVDLDHYKRSDITDVFDVDNVDEYIDNLNEWD